MRPPNDKKVILGLLRHLERDDCPSALQSWFTYQKTAATPCSYCPHVNAGPNIDHCSLCLEAKLRTLSLYQHGEASLEASLIEGARKLQAYHQEHGAP